MEINNFSNRVTASVAIFHASYRGQAPATHDLSVVESAARIIEAGFGVELWLSEHHYAPYSDQAIKQLAAVCKNAPIVTAHTNIHIWDPDALCEEIRFAGQFGPLNLVVHPNTLGFEKCDTPPNENDLRRVGKYALDNGICLAFENSGRTGVIMLRRLLDMIGGDFGSTGIGMCIDTGHANRSTHRDGLKPEDYIREFADLILEVHVNDNEGHEDLHLPPGEGTIDWPAVLSEIHRLRDNAVLCLEITTPDDPITTLLRTRKYLSDSFTDELKY